MARAGGTGPIGPYPPRVGDDDEARDAYDRERRRVLWAMPSGLHVVGSAGGGRRNLMTLNWATQVSFEPKLLGIAVDTEAVTHALISEGRCFSLCLVARDDRAIVRKFTKPLEEGPGPDELGGFPVRTGVSGAPILQQAAGYIDCRVRQAVDCGGHTFFIGEVVDAAFAEGVEEPEVLRMEDTRMSYGG